MSAEKRLAGLDIGDFIWGMAQTAASTAADGVRWTGGALAGEFNQKATVGQVVVDAIISMFPIAGEITSARDATAIGLRMSENQEARNNKWQWVSLVLCLLAVVPIVGGLLKGVGRLVMRAVSQSEDLVKLGQEILSFLRKMGYGNAYKWLCELDFMKYQDDVLRAVRMLIDRISRAAQFIVKRIGTVLPSAVHAKLQKLPEQMQRIGDLAGRMVPQALKELNDNLNRVRQVLVDGSYIAPIYVGGKVSKVWVQEGRLVSKKSITGHVEHPPATLSQYRHESGWPDLEEMGRSKLKAKAEIEQADSTGHLWPISTFSAKGHIVAHTTKPGESLYRILDKTPPPGKTAPKYTFGFHQAGDCWTPLLPTNGKEFRTNLAVKHGWNANGFYEKLEIPSAVQMNSLGIAVPSGWQGVRSWRGTAAGQLDNEEIANGLKATHTWLEGGGVQHFIDWSHPHNAPVKEYLLRTVQVKPSGWRDLQLPVNSKINTPHVVTLADAERSAKIHQEGYVLRGAAAAGKQSNNSAQEN